MLKKSKQSLKQNQNEKNHHKKTGEFNPVFLLHNIVFFFGVKKEPRSLDCSAPPARRGSLRFPDVALCARWQDDVWGIWIFPTPLKTTLGGAGQEVNSLDIKKKDL